MKPKKVLKYHSFLYGLGKLVVETNDGIRGYKSAGSKNTLFIEEFRPRRSLMSRYAKKMINNRFYGTIQHDGA